MNLSRNGISKWLLGAVAIWSVGCSGYFLAASKQGFAATELKRAAFELGCPAEKIELTELVASSTPATPDEVATGGNGAVVGVSGCGRQRTYKYVASAGWIAQSEAARN